MENACSYEFVGANCNPKSIKQNISARIFIRVYITHTWLEIVLQKNLKSKQIALAARSLSLSRLLAYCALRFARSGLWGALTFHLFRLDGRAKHRIAKPHKFYIIYQRSAIGDTLCTRPPVQLANPSITQAFSRVFCRLLLLIPAHVCLYAELDSRV